MVAIAIGSTVFPLLHAMCVQLVWTTIVPEVLMEAITVNAETLPVTRSYSLYEIIMMIYFTGVLLAAVVLLYRFISLYVFVRTKCRKVDKTNYYLLPENYSPTAFSFFWFLFVHSALDETTKGFAIAHERVHIRQLHSLDNLLYEFLCVIFWFNPLYRSAKKELTTLHEYIADEQSSGNNKTQYSRTLVAQSLGVPYQSLIHSYNCSSAIKKRLIMLTKQKTNNVFKLVYLLLIPVIMGVAIMNSVAYATNDKEKVYDSAEKMPEFKGDLMGYITKHINYPVEAKKKKLEGKVYVGFVINTKGAVEDVKVLKGIDPLLDNEVVKMVKAMPVWTPGEDKGKVVAVRFNLPVKFKL